MISSNENCLKHYNSFNPILNYNVWTLSICENHIKTFEIYIKAFDNISWLKVWLIAFIIEAKQNCVLSFKMIPKKGIIRIKN